MSTLLFFLENNVEFRVTFDAKNLTCCNFFWAPSEAVFKKKVRNYSHALVGLAADLEAKKNFVCPSSDEMRLWENKAFMQEVFVEKGIAHPSTVLHRTTEPVPDNLIYPLLLKGEFSSGSKDIYKVCDKTALEQLIAQNNLAARFDRYIFQSLIDMRRDLRITIVDQDIVLWYWRVNPSDEWKPTASSLGSYISFDDYPSHWHNYFLEVMTKLDLRMAAFDYAWEGDDLSQEPLLLEVSPRFSPNPVYRNDKITYGSWKKKLFSKQSYVRLQAELILEINRKYLSSFFYSQRNR